MDDFSPYKSPQPFDENRGRSEYAPKPDTVTWYKVYAGFMTALYLVLAVAGAFLVAYAADLADADHDEVELQMMGVLYGVLGIAFAIVFAVGLFVPRRKWGWIYSIVLICIGLTSCCTLPACIPLLIFWVKPETKRYFGM
jgi:MFS family permease